MASMLCEVTSDSCGMRGGFLEATDLLLDTISVLACVQFIPVVFNLLADTESVESPIQYIPYQLL